MGSIPAADFRPLKIWRGVCRVSCLNICFSLKMPAYGNVCLRVVFVVVAVVIVVAVVTVVVGMFALPRETFFRHLAAIFTKKNFFSFSTEMELF